MLPERLSTDLTSLEPGRDRAWRWWSRLLVTRRRGRDLRHLPGHRLQPRQARLRRAWRRGSTVTAPPPARLTAVPGLEAQIRMQDAAAQAMRQRRHQRGALTLRDARGAAGVRRRHPVRPATGREEPREGADRGLHDRGQRRDRAVPREGGLLVAAARPAARPSAGTGSSASREASGETLPPPARRPGAQEFLVRRRRRRSRSVSRPVAVRRQAARLRRVRGGHARGDGRKATSASPCGTTRTRPRPTAASPTSSPSAC